MLRSTAITFRNTLRISCCLKPAKVFSPVLTTKYKPISILATIRLYSVNTTDSQIAQDDVTNLSINEYYNISEEYLETLTDHLVDLSQEYPQIDAEYSHGVLTLELPPSGTYVINKQPPNKQIWLSSPISGPDRFDVIDGKWISLRTKKVLGDVLRKEIQETIDAEVTLEGIDDK